LYGTIIVLGLFSGLFSCNKDLGNYDYVTINAVDSINDVWDVRAQPGEKLRMSPKIVLAEGTNKDDFTYKWYRREGGNEVGKGEWVVLQEGLRLEVDVVDPIGTPGKTYTLAFEMVNKTTGISYRRVFRLMVETPFAKGYAALVEQENGFDITMIALTPENELVPYYNILESTGSALPREGEVPYGIYSARDRFAPNPYAKTADYSLWVSTDKRTTRLNIDDYSWDPSLDISNIVEKGSYLDREYVKKNRPIVASKMVLGRFNAVRLYMYHKETDDQGNERGNWYFYTDYGTINLLSVPMNGVRSTDAAKNGARFEPAPYVAPMSQGAMHFDVENNKFMYQMMLNAEQNFNSKEFWYTEPIPTEQDGVRFKFNDPNKGLLHMDGRPHSGGQGIIQRGYAITKQMDDTFKYIEFSGRIPALSNLSMAAYSAAYRFADAVFPADSPIANAKFFARPDEGSNSPFFYYVTNDNRVMKVDVSAKAAVEEDITSQIIKDDGYNEITLFKYTIPESATDSGLATDPEHEVRRSLAVATYNSSLGKDKGGKLEFFTCPSYVTGNLTLAKFPDKPREEEGKESYQIDMSWKDMGRIVGLTYKRK
jgi:hypothetical protein